MRSVANSLAYGDLDHFLAIAPALNQLPSLKGAASLAFESVSSGGVVLCEARRIASSQRVISPLPFAR